MAKETKSNRTAKYSKTEELVLTPSEKLVLWRRRKEWNQKTAAAFYLVPLFTYKFAEMGKSKDFKFKKIELNTLEPHEKCFIWRRRSKKTQEEIAREMGRGRYWVRLQELGRVSSKELFNYWTATK